MDTGLAAEVRRRAAGICEYCKIPEAWDELPFQLDHIIARQHSGWTTEDNLALACYACNHHKGPNIAGFDLVTQSIVPLFHPRRDAWSDHFRWSDAEIVGLTPVGRVTVHVLAVNLDYRVDFRRTLIDEGTMHTS